MRRNRQMGRHRSGDTWIKRYTEVERVRKREREKGRHREKQRD